MTYSLLNEFSGSTLFPSKHWVEREDFHSLAEKAYLHMMALRAMLCIPATQDYAEGYLHSTIQYGHFRQWRSGATDLYVILWALTQGEYEAPKGVPDTIGELPFIRWLRALRQHADDTTETKRLFLKLDAMLHISESSMKSIRRLTQEWPNISHSDKQLVVTRLLQMMRSRMPRSSCIRPLTNAARKHDLELHDVCNKETGENCGKGHQDYSAQVHHKEEPKSKYKFLASLAGFATGFAGARALRNMKENASSGSTAAANVASAAKNVGGAHPGFDPNGHKGIYDTGKPKKSTIIRR